MNKGPISFAMFTPKRILVVGFIFSIFLFPISSEFVRQNEQNVFTELEKSIELNFVSLIRQADFGVLAVNTYFLSDDVLFSDASLGQLTDKDYLLSHFPALVGMGITDKDFLPLSFLSAHHPKILGDHNLRDIVKDLPKFDPILNQAVPLSKSLTLIENGKQFSCFIAMTPIVRKGILAGWSFAVGDFTYLARSIAPYAQDRIDLEVFLGTKPSNKNLAFDYDGIPNDKEFTNTLKQTLPFGGEQLANEIHLKLLGADWSLRILSKPSFHTGINIALPWFMSLVTFIFTILLAQVSSALSRTHSRVSKLVQEQTVQLQLKTLALESALTISTENEQRANTIIESIPGYVSWFTKDLNYLGVNHELARVNGLKPNDFQGKKLGDFNGGDSTFINMILLFSQTKETNKILELKAYMGKIEKTLLVSLKKFSHDDKILVISIDISELKHLQDELQLAKAQNANSSRLSSLGEMAAGIAHEINNPLAIIMGRTSILARLLEKEPIDINRMRDSLKTIQKTTERITKIIKGLRTFARDGDRDPTQTVSVFSLLSETLDLCTTRFKNNGISIDIVPMDHTLRVACRPTQIMQVLVNLLNNANDAAVDCQEKWIRVEAKLSGNLVSFIITDSGTGIPSSVQQKLMTPFFTTKEVGKGTGLGLSISRGIAESHGGTLTYNANSPNTQFILNIPAVAATAISAA